MPIDPRDRQTGMTFRLTVIGAVKDATPQAMLGISTSQRTLARTLEERAQPTAYWLGLRKGADPRTAASAIKSAAILVGTVLGLGISYNVIADQAKQPSWDTFAFTVPWLSLGGIFLAVYAVGLLTTLAPAVRASRVYPAEALRYQ